MLKRTIPIIALFSMLFVPVTVQAQNLEGNLSVCSFVGPICDAFGINVDSTGGNADEVAISFTTTRIQQGLSLIFIGIIILSVFIIIQAGIKYIQSQGNEGEIEEAQKAIKSVFIGIAVLFVGILGVILVLAFFGGTGLLGSDTQLDDLFLEEGEAAQDAGTNNSPFLDPDGGINQ